MRLEDFSYHLPPELIASEPCGQRTQSRLLCLDRHTGAIGHRHFHQLALLLQPGDLLVFNDTRVIPARLYGRKQSGGKVEILVERILPGNEVLALARSSKPLRTGVVIELDTPNAPVTLTVQKDVKDRIREIETRRERGSGPPGQEDAGGLRGDLVRLRFHGPEPVMNVLERVGHMPLPPYIDRPDNADDRDRYQTVYGTRKGAVAAPTAGLHFDHALLEELTARGVEQCFITLHVGAGTFQPVRVTNIQEHRMHSEVVRVSAEVCQRIRGCKKRRGRVIAVGTTTVRSLEAAALGGGLNAFEGETDIFIYPGFRFKVVDALITNFHLPESTLLMLVSAFAGRELTLNAYDCAVAHGYRFFSYGDAMFIEGLSG